MKEYTIFAFLAMKQESERNTENFVCKKEKDLRLQDQKPSPRWQLITESTPIFGSGRYYENWRQIEP